VPLTQERYDLVFPEAVWNSAAGQLLVAVIRSSEFRETVLQLQGYDLTAMGQETWLQ
jgi:molybdate-binding protein